MQIAEARALAEDEDSGSGKGQAALVQVAHALAGARAQLGQHGAVFARGRVAAHVAALLQEIPAPPPPLEPAYTGPVAWVLLDRSCDLLTALSPPQSTFAACIEGRAAGAADVSRQHPRWPLSGGPGHARWWQLASEGDDEAVARHLEQALPAQADHQELRERLHSVGTFGSDAYLGMLHTTSPHITVSGTSHRTSHCHVSTRCWQPRRSTG
jgi:hypothetical protein